MDKRWANAAAAVADVPDGATIMVGGFSFPGAPRTLIQALADHGARDLTLIANGAGGPPGTPEIGLLVERGLVRKAIVSFPVARQPDSPFERQYVAGQIELELVPQGTLAERIRAGGAGIPAFYTPSGADTVLADGKPRAVFDGRECVLETALRADFALVHAEAADPLGNLVFHATARNFNPVMAMAARVTIAEANRIVAAGDLDPEAVVTPGLFVDRVVPAEIPMPPRRAPAPAEPGEVALPRRNGKPVLSRTDIAARIARELRDGDVVNLGTGLPSLVANYVPPGVRLVLHAENGVLGFGAHARPGEEDPELASAGANLVTLLPGAAFFHSADSFAMVRGGHIDVAVLGGYQVSAQGDLANWIVPGQKVPAVGGAMDLVRGARRVIVGMEHTTRDGGYRLLNACTYPLTGRACVSTVVTDLAVIDVTPDGLLLREIAPGWTVDEVQALTEPPLRPAPDLRPIALS
ncbi:MAG TPA: 3-oxoacid CoA-transferase subunit B [Chloroflexota bacterium]|nr:3-oxoacid CoA-transferase subunit B [Chloroflexota bacterium]